VTPLSFAIVTDSERTEQALGVFCRRIETSTGLRVAPHAVPSYADLIEATLADKVDLAWASPLVALRLLQSSAVDLIAVVQRSSRAGYHSALFARADAPFRRPGDLSGVRAAWVSRESASGYFVPRWHLRSLGVDPKLAFSEERFLGSHEAVAEAVLERTSDVGATHVGLDSTGGSLTSAPWLSLGAPASAVRVLLLIGPIPGDVIFASRRVAPRTRRQLTAALLALRGDDAAGSANTVFEATRFEPVPSGHLRLLEELGAYDSEGAPESGGRKR
jgi:two-component system, NtrC family, sensor kinase